MSRKSLLAAYLRQQRELSMPNFPMSLSFDLKGFVGSIAPPPLPAKTAYKAGPVKEVRPVARPVRPGPAPAAPANVANPYTRLSRLKPQPFLDKPVAIESASPGVLGGVRAQYHLRQTFVALEARVFNKPEVFVGQAHQKIDATTGELTDQPTRDIIAQQLAGFAAFTRAHKHGEAMSS